MKEVTWEKIFENEPPKECIKEPIPDHSTVRTRRNTKLKFDTENVAIF